MKTVQVRNITLGEGRPKICVPIVGQTKDDILLEAGTFARIPVDVVEWRVDWFEDVFDTDKVLDVAKDLQTVLKDTPILFTFRTAKEGGEKAISYLAEDVFQCLRVDLVIHLGQLCALRCRQLPLRAVKGAGVVLHT